jgi:hypothetical protein
LNVSKDNEYLYEFYDVDLNLDDVSRGMSVIDVIIAKNKEFQILKGF